MTNQEIAKAVYAINWSSVQSDCPAEGAGLEFLWRQLEGLDKTQIIDIMFHVQEAQALIRDYGKDEDSPFKDMDQFKYLK